MSWLSFDGTIKALHVEEMMKQNRIGISGSGLSLHMVVYEGIGECS
jgi:hypothetical protein